MHVLHLNTHCGPRGNQAPSLLLSERLKEQDNDMHDHRPHARVDDRRWRWGCFLNWAQINRVEAKATHVTVYVAAMDVTLCCLPGLPGCRRKVTGGPGEQNYSAAYWSGKDFHRFFFSFFKFPAGLLVYYFVISTLEKMFFSNSTDSNVSNSYIWDVERHHVCPLRS